MKTTSVTIDIGQYRTDFSSADGNCHRGGILFPEGICAVAVGMLRRKQFLQALITIELLHRAPRSSILRHSLLPASTQPKLNK